MYCVVITTCKKDDEKKIIDALISSRLAACVNSWPVKSTYIWKGKVEEDEEYILFIKTKKERYKEVEEKIKSVHSYEVPEIICFDIKEGNESYLKWIDEVVK